MLKMMLRELQRSRQLQLTLFSVVMNMSLTLSIWIGIYQMKVNSELSKMYFLDDSFNWTTGNPVYDGLINGFCTILVLGCVSFIMLAFVLYDFRRIVKMWLTFSCILILFGVSGQTIYDLVSQILDQNDENEFLATVFLTVVPTVIYGCLGIYVSGILGFSGPKKRLFRLSSPTDLSFSINFSSFPIAPLSLFFTFEPFQNTPLDLFAVLAPMGPLKMVQEKASDYSNTILKFVMFAAEDKREAAGMDDLLSEDVLNDERKMRKDVKKLIEMYSKKDAQDDEFLQKIRQRRAAINPDSDQSGHTEHSPLALSESSPVKLKEKNSDNEDDDESDTTESSSDSSGEVTSSVSTSELSTANECDEEEWEQLVQNVPEIPEVITAADALNDGETVRLGFGDFVFYSLLIGQAATGGCPIAVAFAAFGILFGLIATLTVLSSDESTTPALPLPVICGTFGYFVSKLLMDQIYG